MDTSKASLTLPVWPTFQLSAAPRVPCPLSATMPSETSLLSSSLKCAQMWVLNPSSNLWVERGSLFKAQMLRTMLDWTSGHRISGTKASRPPSLTWESSTHVLPPTAHPPQMPAIGDTNGRKGEATSNESCRWSMGLSLPWSYPPVVGGALHPWWPLSDSNI